MTWFGTAAALLIATSQPTPAPSLDATLAEVRHFAGAEGERLWPGYGGAPFGFLLIDGNAETLLCRDVVPQGFTPAGREPATGCSRATRPRSGLPDTLLAAMPLFGPPSTIVMGTPAGTGRAEPDWIRTILHEHFHQWQAELPDYYARLDALDLKDGDETGMWALNFPFPYADAEAGRRHREAAAALADAVAARGSPAFPAAFDRYLNARRAFAGAVGTRNWRYAEFQLWQEGVARWTEIALGRLYPDERVRTAAAALEARTLAGLHTEDLTGRGREFVYAYGAAEAMLLEACDPSWRQAYVSAVALGPLLERARPRCARPSS